MFIDKSRAVHKEWRIPEKTLMFVSLIGGSIGMFAGMHIFRHKTKHIKFTLGVPFIFIIELITAVYLIK
ncbi:phosphoesterase [Clostridium butyricum DKU-01]|nr:phosphoesterase [Clostridium butyricum DKU-01]KIU08740.1 phosphoesterase [Clostridium butyricum]